MTNGNRKWFGTYVMAITILFCVGQVRCADCSLSDRAFDSVFCIIGAAILGSALWGKYPFVPNISSDNRRHDEVVAIMLGLFFMALPLGRMFF